jgi:hypothetical protein
MFRGSVNSTGYPLHSPVSPSLTLPCVTMCHHISTGFYLLPHTKVSEYPNCQTFVAAHIELQLLIKRLGLMKYVTTTPLHHA